MRYLQYKEAREKQAFKDTCHSFPVWLKTSILFIPHPQMHTHKYIFCNTEFDMSDYCKLIVWPIFFFFHLIILFIFAFDWLNMSVFLSIYKYTNLSIHSILTKKEVQLNVYDRRHWNYCRKSERKRKKILGTLYFRFQKDCFWLCTLESTFLHYLMHYDHSSRLLYWCREKNWRNISATLYCYRHDNVAAHCFTMWLQLFEFSFT